MRRLSVVAVCTIAYLSITPAGAKQSPSNRFTINAIDRYCKTLDRFADKHKETRRIFGLVEHYSKDDSTEEQHAISSGWKEFKNEDAWENSGSDTQNEAAAIWLKNGKVTTAYFTYQSESGDWVIYASYYFDSAGATVKIHSILNTFEGNITAIRDWYFDNGTLISEKKSLRDLTTQKPKNASVEYYDIPTKMYLKESELPFSNLLK